jgi:zinc and cadmium transporter
MSLLAQILLAATAGGALSVLLAGIMALRAQAQWVPLLVSCAIGALLGAAFLEILPHAMEHAEPGEVTAAVLAGILFFFVLEKLVLWRHCHDNRCETDHDHGRSGLLIMIGDTFHNFVDGVLIAAAFLADPALGMVTAVAIIAHEIPQELGDFLILLHSGYSKTRALVFNLASSAATLLGALLAWFTLSDMLESVPYLLALAAASMIYVSIADLLPNLHKKVSPADTAQQVALISLGIGVVWLAGHLAH